MMTETLPQDAISKIVGSYDGFSSDNFESFLIGVGVDKEHRQNFNIKKWHTVITHNPRDDSWAADVIAGPTKKTITFKMGQQFKDVSLDSSKCTSIVNVSPESKTTFIYNQTCGKQLREYTLEFTGEELRATFKCGNAQGKQIYKKRK